MSNLEIKGYEAKHITLVNNTFNDTDDALCIKENIHYSDGSIKPNLRLIKNWERPVYITKPGFRKHKEKKESEKLSKLEKRMTNDRGRVKTIARSLGKHLTNSSLKKLAREPYVYGADISAPTLMKHHYMSKFPDLTSASTVAVLDIETDVVEGTEQILSVCITCNDKRYLAVNEWFVKGIPNVKDKIKRAFKKYLNKYDTPDIDLVIEVLPTPGACCQSAIAWAHTVKPDFMAVWNIDFDLPRIINALKREHYDIAEVFSDPSIPIEYRDVWYKPGTDVKLTANGSTYTVPPQERWHVLNAPSSFYWIDAMVVYAMIRKAKGLELSYSLDYILNKILGLRKLKFSFADHLNGIDWHFFMQSEYKIEYLIYNMFDCIGVEELDDKTKDLQITLSELCGFSEIKNFNSTPTQLADDLHFFYLEKGEVIASKSDRMSDDLDKYVIGMDGHIITLATHLNQRNGIKPFVDFPNLETLIRRYVSD